MKRLLKSSKFWLAVIGAAVAILTWKITQDANFAMYVSGLFGLGILGNAGEDMISQYRTGNPDPTRPKDDDDNGDD